jgi:trimeric autotransporter adhesin
MNPLIQVTKVALLFVIAFAVTCFALSPIARALLPPPAPDGDYPGGNTAEGLDALYNLTTGSYNTAIGDLALFFNTTGSDNTASGAYALQSNTTGSNNTASGAYALVDNTTGSNNTASGFDALYINTTGGYNVAIGWFSLKSAINASFNTGVGAGTLALNTANYNTATGAGALLLNTGGANNTANGALALIYNDTGSDNSAFGEGALLHNTTGSSNNAFGSGALSNHQTGSFSNAVGVAALFADQNGEENNAFGDAALSANVSGFDNTAVGDGALQNSTGNFNTALGARSGANVATADNVICIGYNVDGGDVSDTTWVGNVYGVSTQSGTTAPVIVSNSGQLGTVASSERFKKDIAAMEKASEAILSLRPVTFHYKTDNKGTPQFGLIAEEVSKVTPALVLLDKDGKPYSVRYEAVNVMLLNEFLKEHRKLQEQEATIAQLKNDFESRLAKQERQTRALASGLEKVSAQLEASKSAARTALNDR